MCPDLNLLVLSVKAALPPAAMWMQTPLPSWGLSPLPPVTAKSQ